MAARAEAAARASAMNSRDRRRIFRDQELMVFPLFLMRFVLLDWVAATRQDVRKRPDRDCGDSREKPQAPYA